MIKFLINILIICGFFISVAYAETNSGATRANSNLDNRVGLQQITEQKSIQEGADCSRGGASEQAQCLKLILNQKEKELDSLIKEAIRSFKSEWGEDALVENKKRIVDTQEAWKKYIIGHCEFGYYRRAPMHASSSDLQMVGCELDKTKERIKEVRREYLHRHD